MAARLAQAALVPASPSPNRHVGLVTRATPVTGQDVAAPPCDTMAAPGHGHVFLGSGHTHAERRTWAVICLCTAMMVIEVGGGSLFGSIALVADGLHMSTHAGAMLLAALAYRYARRHAADPRFSFGTGKLGDLAAFTSAVVLAGMAVLIGIESVGRLAAPVPIRFSEAIPIACLGLCVNISSAWLLAGAHGDAHEHAHGHEAAQRDNNLRGIMLHVMTDAAVTVFVILGLLLARAFGWVWMDPVAGLAGACVIGVWSVRLARAAGGILLDMMPSPAVSAAVTRLVQSCGDTVADLHVWRLGPGHLGVILSVRTTAGRDAGFYRPRLLAMPLVSHVTVEISAS